MIRYYINSNTGRTEYNWPSLNWFIQNMLSTLHNEFEKSKGVDELNFTIDISFCKEFVDGDLF